MVKTGRVAVRLEDGLKEKVEALAAADRRSLSSWIEALVAREVDRIEAKKAKPTIKR